MFKFFSKNKSSKADILYGHIVRQARQPFYYTKGGVPDTQDGRFDMIVLQMFIVLERLAQNSDGPIDSSLGNEELKQDLFDAFLKDMELNLREMSIGDSGIKIRIRKMIEGFYGRTSAYRESLEESGPALTDALQRNLFRKSQPSREQLEFMEESTRIQHAKVTGLSIPDLLDGTWVTEGKSAGEEGMQ